MKARIKKRGGQHTQPALDCKKIISVSTRARTRPLSPARQVCQSAGLTVAEAARRAELSPARFCRYLKYGAPFVAQMRIGRVFQDPVVNMILIVGYKRAMEVEGVKAQRAHQARESRDASLTAGGEDVARRRTRPSNILELIPGGKNQ